jgi:hypothetical protein
MQRWHLRGARRCCACGRVWADGDKLLDATLHRRVTSPQWTYDRFGAMAHRRQLWCRHRGQVHSCTQACSS